ncbi:MAG: DUF1801 domain-containing protein [Candidatus Shapirobacteria bacterium]|nr:DUF1801 domain-containing protein [Candidatus Shapirobacteria bacterium]MDD4410150.1 DUF1801 domain-containing protein [Candidatus Shapirobacteria bacterium]
MADKEIFINKIDPNFLDIFERITKAIESVDEKLDCEIKWGKLTYGLSGDYHHWICGIAQTKKSLNLIFHFGGLLEDKNKKFIVGESFFLRKLEYSSIDNVDIAVIKDFVKQAINKVDYFKENWKILSKESKK